MGKTFPLKTLKKKSYRICHGSFCDWVDRRRLDGHGHQVAVVVRLIRLFADDPLELHHLRVAADVESSETKIFFSPTNLRSSFSLLTLYIITKTEIGRKVRKLQYPWKTHRSKYCS